MGGRQPDVDTCRAAFSTSANRVARREPASGAAGALFGLAHPEACVLASRYWFELVRFGTCAQGSILATAA
jgi:hypothetical protein